jgi:protoporphyrinogen/coproporphyrinogen III oxidase
MRVPADRPPVIIVGGGFAGLIAARELQRRSIPVQVFEAGPQVAGLARTFRDAEGFTYDFGAHFITNRLAAAVGVERQCRTVRYYGESVILRGRAYSYPFGLARSPRFALSAAAGVLRGAGRHQEPESAAAWFRARYGQALADEVAIPLMEAWSGARAADLAPSVGEKFASGVAQTLFLKLASRVTRRAVASGYCREAPESVRVWHVYPEDGVATLCEALLHQLGGVVQLESPVEAILVEGDRAVGVRVRGREIEAAAVVSTAPVHVLAKLVTGTAALAHLARFKYRPMTFVNLRFRGRHLLPNVVTWTPEPGLPFFRLTEAPISMPWLAPAGKTLITVDFGCQVGDAIWQASDEQLGELCLTHLDTVIPDARRRYLGCHVLRTPIAYPVFLSAYEAERQRLERGTGVNGLYSIGRNGEFAHILMEDVYWRTLRRMNELATSGPTAVRAAQTA